MAQENLYAADMLLTQQALEGSNFGRARELLERWQHPTRRRSDLRGWEWHYLWRLCHSDELATLGGHQSPVTALAFALHGRRLASASRMVRSASGTPPPAGDRDGSTPRSEPGVLRRTAGVRRPRQGVRLEKEPRWHPSVFESPADRVMTVHLPGTMVSSLPVVLRN
jgi:hypothetical protein